MKIAGKHLKSRIQKRVVHTTEGNVYTGIEKEWNRRVVT